MSLIVAEWLAYLVPLASVLAIYLWRRRCAQARGVAALRETTELGLTEPPSLHPVVDPAICVCSGACTRECPERALGIIGATATLVNPSLCIGHGACAASCPVDAIKLVFGTERRGIDIPYVKPSFETNVNGIYIAGELGGMGLIGKSAEQGRQAVASILRDARRGADLDLIIVGAGPAGISATLAATQHGLRFVTVEQEDSLGGTAYHYPRNKVVMTHPVDLPTVGKVSLGEISKEKLLEFWQGIINNARLPIRFSERMEAIGSDGNLFVVTTPKCEYHAPNVLLAIGRRGTPRKLGATGEHQAKVVYRLIDAEQYRNQKVLVVGGGDSAIEAALAVAEQAGTEVILSYRGDAFSRAKPKNRQAVVDAEASGSIRVMLGSTVESISSDCVDIKSSGRNVSLDNDAVIVCAGGILPMPMLKDVGIMVETKFGTA